MANMANLDEIIVLLSKISDLRNTNGIIFRAFEETLQSLLRSDVSDNEFDAFLDKLHNRLVRYSSVFRVYGLRAIRHLLTSTTKVELLYERNIHLIVIESFECDQEYLHERMQAIQLIRKCFAVAPDIANLGFVRSIVAIASESADKFRRIAADTICDLVLKNPAIVAEANGMGVLYKLMLQPDCEEMIQPIVLCLLHLHNSPQTRAFVQFESNLSTVVSPFTDFDTTASDSKQRLRSARLALVIIMRNWGGLHALSQGEKGLRSLGNQLCDANVSPDIQNAVLDLIGEVLEPVISRTNSYTKPSKLSGLKKLSTKHLRQGSTPAPRGSDIRQSASGASYFVNLQPSSSINGSLSPKQTSAEPVLQVPSNRLPRSQSLPEKDRPCSRLSVDDDDDDDLSQSSGSSHSLKTLSRSGSQVFATPVSQPIPENAVVDTPVENANISTEKKGPRRSFKKLLNLGRIKSSSPTTTPEKDVTTTTGTSSTGEADSSPGSIYKPPRAQHRRASDLITGTAIVEELSADGRLKSKTLDMGYGSNPISLGFIINGCDEMDIPSLERNFSFKSAEDYERPRGDPIYNLLDTYAVMLCVALLRAGFFPAICTVATLGSVLISDKARKILVHLLGVISRLFPDRTCSQLLSDPSLIEFASTFASLKLSDRALKASQLLLSLSTAFSLSRGRGGYTANSILSNASNRKVHVAANGCFLDSISGFDYSSSVDAKAIEDAAKLSSTSTPSPVSNSDVLASRIRGHRVTRVVSDVLDEIAHTAFSRVSRIVGTAAALKDNNPEAFKNRHVRGKSEPDRLLANGATSRSSLSHFMFGDNHSKSSLNVPSSVTEQRNSISTELLAAPLRNIDKGGQTREDLMYEIKIVVMPLIDKVEFTRQMDASKVVGKEGKEPFKWDWEMLSEMLEYCVRYPERLQEAMKTKWVKRLSGFFRCSSDDKGYFSNLDWYPSNLHYLECACHLYGVLVEQESAQNPFLGVDRRGMLFAEIVSEIEYVVGLASRIGSSQATLASAYPAGHVVTNNISPATSRSVFRIYGCTQLMSREFFTLMGRLCGTQSGRSLVEGNQIYGVLSTLGQHACLDYLSRVALTSISFTDEGFMSQNMLQILPVSVGSSDGMKKYSHMLLRSLLRSRDPKANSWMVDTVSAQLLYDNMPTESVVRVLEEIVQDGAYIKTLSNSLGQLINVSGTESILIRLLAVPDGVEQLHKFKWIEPNIKKWLFEGGCTSYSDAVENSLFDALCVKHGPTALARKSDYVPIPIACRPYSVHPQASRRFSWYPDGGADIEGLLRAPWNIECRIGSQSAGQRTSFTTAAPDYIRIDSYLDASDMPSSASGETTSDDLRIVKVRGLVIDDKGLPSAIIVPADRTLSTCLLCGVCPVYRDGRVYADPSQSSAAGNQSTMGNNSSSTTGNPATSSSVSVMTQRRKYFRNNENGSGIFNDRNVSNGTPQENVDPPLTYQTEHLQDWSYCKPSQRQMPMHQRDLGDGKISVEIPGDPVCWIFSKSNPCRTFVAKTEASPASGAQGKVHDAVAGGLESIALSQRLAQERAGSISGVLYLVEVHFMLRLITGDPTIVPMRRHMFGELGRTIQGCKFLQEENVIPSLLAETKLASRVEESTALDDEDEGFTPVLIPHSGSAESLVLFDLPEDGVLAGVAQPDSSTSEEAVIHRIKAAVWALGHIGSTDNGFEILQRSDPNFVTWCIDMTYNAAFFSVRSVCFSALGLLSRSDKSKEIFSHLGWDCSTNQYSAVAIPNDLTQLYKPVRTAAVVSSNDSIGLFSEQSTPRAAQIKLKRVYLYNLISGVISPSKKELYCDVLECIAKLPGHILYKETKSKLSKLRASHPEMFSERALYLATHQVLLLFSFSLAIRRHVFSLFQSDARMDKPPCKS